MVRTTTSPETMITARYSLSRMTNLPMAPSADLIERLAQQGVGVLALVVSVREVVGLGVVDGIDSRAA